MPSSAVLMTKMVLFFIFLMIWGQAAAAQSVEKTIFTIDVHGNGDALWTVEKRLSLTASEMNEWEGILKKGQNISRYQKEIKAELDGLLVSAQNSTNRSMKIEDFNISYNTVKTLSGGYGVVLYSFEWGNFSRTGSGKIIIGDAFSGMEISSENTLIIRVPDGFVVQSVSPAFDRRDGNNLIWDGPVYHSFSKGEPALVFSPVADQEPPRGMDQGLWVSIIVSAVILVPGILFVFWKRMRGKAYGNKTDVSDVSTADGAGRTGEIAANAVQIGTDIQTDADGLEQPDNAIQANDTGPGTAQTESAGMPQLPDTPDEFLGDEEMIERYIINRGGQAYQSDIVKDSGLSKSKISIVLAKMKEDGTILKIRKGKENIIRLAAKK